MKRMLCVAIAGALSAVALSATPAAAQDYRGQYWYHKYFGPTDPHPYRAREGRDALPRSEVQIRAYDQGFYNAHHLHHAADRPEIYALAREGEFDNEVAIVIDDSSGQVISAVVLPH